MYISIAENKIASFKSFLKEILVSLEVGIKDIVCKSLVFLRQYAATPGQENC